MTRRLLTTQRIVNLPSDPSNGTAGEVYYNSSSDKLRFYNGTLWTDVSSGSGGSSVTVSDTAPTTSSVGDQWYESSTGILYIYYDSYWVQVAPGGNGTSGGGGGVTEPVAGLDFNTGSPDSDSVGRLAWNDGEGTLNLGLKGGQVVLQLGQEQVVRVYNATGATLEDGKVVYIVGAQGQRPAVALARADNELTSAYVLGVTTETIGAEQEGFVTTFGIVKGIDTSAFTEGAAIWLSATTAGAFTETKPVAPNHLVQIGFVVKAHDTSGEIFVRNQNGYELEELHDVLIGTKADRDVIMYDSVTGLWKNEQINLGTDTVGNYVASISTSDGISGGAAGSEGTAISLTNTDKGSSQNIFKNIVVSGQSDIVADSNNDTLTFASGTGVAITTNATTDTLTITNSGVTGITGTSNEVEVSASTGSVTIGLPNDVTIGNNLTVTGTLTVNGTTTTVNSNTLTVDDPIISLGGDTAPVANDSKDRGIEFRYYDTQARLGFMGYDDSAGTFVFLTAATNTSEVFSGTKGTIDANISGSNINTGTVSATYIDSAIARLSSPTFTGTPEAPTAAADTNTTQIATTAFVIGQGYLKASTASSTYAPLASPTFTGTVTAATLDLTTAATATTATSYWVETGSDGVVRPKTLENVRTEIVTTSAVNSAAATTVGTITSGIWQGSSISTTYTDAKVTSVNGSTGAVTGLAQLSGANFTGTISFSQNENAISVTGLPSRIAGVTTGLISVGSLSYSAKNAGIVYADNTDNYVQLIVQNKNSGAFASANIVVSNNLGSDSSKYGLFGMNSSGSTVSGATGTANAVVLTSVNDPIYIGPSGVASLNFVTNNIVRASIDLSGNFTTTTAPANTNSTRIATTEFVQNAVKTAPQTIQNKSASYTAQVTDAGSVITFDSASNLTFTIDSTLGLSAGQRIDVVRLGTGTLTVQQGSGATVNGTPSLVLRDRYSAATVLCIASNTYLLVGDLA